MSDLRIGIDIGGTNLKGVVIDGNRVITRQKRETRDGTATWREEVRILFDALRDELPGKARSVGLSAPGIAGAQNDSISFMPGRLQGLENFNWSELLDFPTYVINDAHAALWAEAQWGVGRDIDNIVMITLGTGVGGGLLINGQLIQGFLQRAGHLGHMALDTSIEDPDITGITGSLEDAIGESTIKRRSSARFATTYELVKSYEAGDTWATYVWLTSVRKLALGIASLCNTISPELVILAGGITKAGVALLDPLHSFLDIYEWRPGGQSTPIKIAQYQDYAGAIGAALYSGQL
ncbi:MAG: ROK family protein, partial [Saprospiraceae bacterium]|nr:ROK family protein [Saprospiraceae bacterium]